MDEVREMLERRADSLEEGDSGGYLEPMTEEARLVERAIATGAQAVPITDVEFSLPTPASTSKDSVRALELDLVYHYERLPEDNEFRIPLVYNLDRMDDQWIITSSAVSPGTKLPIWATGSTEFTTSDHFLALHRPALSDAELALDEAERARARLASKLTFAMDEVHLVLLARNGAEYVSMSARPTPVSAVAQAETTFALTTEDISAEARLILVNLERTGEGDSIETLQHELAHLALAPYTRPFTPAWVGESAAMYLADTRPVSTWREGIRRGTFESLSFVHLTPRLSLGEHDPSSAAISYDYAYSAAAAWYLTETFGAEDYWAFYRSYSEVPASDVHASIPDEGQGARAEAALSQLAISATQDALKRIFRVSSGELDSAVRDWIRAQVP